MIFDAFFICYLVMTFAPSPPPFCLVSPHYFVLLPCFSTVDTMSIKSVPPTPKMGEGRNVWVGRGFRNGVGVMFY